LVESPRLLLGSVIVKVLPFIITVVSVFVFSALLALGLEDGFKTIELVFEDELSSVFEVGSLLKTVEEVSEGVLEELFKSTLFAHPQSIENIKIIENNKDANFILSPFYNYKIIILLQGVKVNE